MPAEASRKREERPLSTYEALNDLLVRLFRDVMEVEQKALINQEYRDITNNDMHVIRAIGTGPSKNMSSIARELSVTVGTLTIAMNSLVKKGYVVRERGKEDRRIVFISLSAKGRSAYEHYERFHREMIASLLDGLGREEIDVLIKTLTHLNQWFRQKEKENMKK